MVTGKSKNSSAWNNSWGWEWQELHRRPLSGSLCEHRHADKNTHAHMLEFQWQDSIVPNKARAPMQVCSHDRN